MGHRDEAVAAASALSLRLKGRMIRSPRFFFCEIFIIDSDVADLMNQSMTSSSEGERAFLG